MACLDQDEPEPERLRGKEKAPPGAETPHATRSAPLPWYVDNSPAIYVGLCHFQGNVHTLSTQLPFVEPLLCAWH